MRLSQQAKCLIGICIQSPQLTHFWVKSRRTKAITIKGLKGLVANTKASEIKPSGGFRYPFIDIDGV